jgi:LemA protein
MMPLFIAAAVFIVVAIVLGLWLMGTYNGLVASRNQYKNSFAQIDVQLKRRYDLIPNLVETAKGYMKHEQETLEKVIMARNQAAAAMKVLGERGLESPDALAGLGAAEGLLGSALGRLMVVSEQYPDLKADRTIIELMEELKSTENRISFARQAFNDFATSYNTRRETFPTNMVAGMFNFQEARLFATDLPEERQAVAVKF